MKLPCALVRDLLPLYHDNVCAPESADAVEEHLRDCGDCREFYHGLGERQEKNQLACLPQAATLMRVKKKIRLQYVLVAVCVLLLCVGGGMGLGMWMNRVTIDIPVENVEYARFEEGAEVTQYSANLEVWGALKIKVKTDYPQSGLSYTVLPMDRKGNKWVMAVAQRVTLWDAVRGWLGLGGQPLGEYSDVYTVKLDYFFWQDRLAEFAGEDQLPPEEEFGCFISEVYYISDFDVFSELGGGMPPDVIRQALSEEGTIIWERPDGLDTAGLVKWDRSDT